MHRVAHLGAATELKIVKTGLDAFPNLGHENGRRRQATVVDLLLVAVVESAAHLTYQFDPIGKGEIWVLSKKGIQRHAVEVIEEHGRTRIGIGHEVIDAQDAWMTFYVFEELRFTTCGPAQLLTALGACLVRDQIRARTAAECLVVRVNRQAVDEPRSAIESLGELPSSDAEPAFASADAHITQRADELFCLRRCDREGHPLHVAAWKLVVGDRLLESLARDDALLTVVLEVELDVLMAQEHEGLHPRHAEAWHALFEQALENFRFEIRETQRRLHVALILSRGLPRPIDRVTAIHARSAFDLHEIERSVPEDECVDLVNVAFRRVDKLDQLPEQVRLAIGQTPSDEFEGLLLVGVI